MFTNIFLIFMLIKNEKYFVLFDVYINVLTILNLYVLTCRYTIFICIGKNVVMKKLLYQYIQRNNIKSVE